jgi:hypothetical protein
MSNRVNIGSYNNTVGPSARKLNKRFVHSFILNKLAHSIPFQYRENPREYLEEPLFIHAFQINGR